MGRKSCEVLVAFLFAVVALASCKKDKPEETVKPVIADTADVVYVVCEGSLGNGNGTLDMYDVKKETVARNIYKSANEADLGDVFQSMELIGDKLFLCINNSDKILVLSRKDHKRIGVIDVPKPRYIVPLGNGKAYVSSLFSNKVHIINTNTLQVTGSITLPAENPEEMLLHNNKVYIPAWDTASDKVFVVNPATDKLESSIAVAGRAPQSVVADKNGMLWVLSGNVTKGKVAMLSVVNPADGKVTRSFQFPDKADPIRPVFNAAKDLLYFIEVDYNGGTEHNGIYKMPVEAASLPAVPFIAAQKFQYFWALGIHPVSNTIFVGDPKGFYQQGTVLVYDAAGNKKTEFQTGVGPGHFYFAN